MKVSMYTFCFNCGQKEWYVYNTLSNALLEVDEHSIALLQDAQLRKRQLKKSNFDRDLWEVLVDKRFIVNRDKDEFLAYKAAIMLQRNQQDSMHLTVAPTMDCNFRCYYCFEKNKKRSYMHRDVIEAIVKYIEALDGLKRIRLTWFGGEPLMATKEMRELYVKLKTRFSGELTSDVITTGYYLTEKTIEILKEIEVNEIQLTLDGDKENHNRIKHTPECADAFSKVLENLDLLTSTAPEIHITIRVNITKHNETDYVPLYRMLVKRYAGKNLGIAPAFVMDRGPKPSCNLSYYFNREESARFILSLFEKEGIHTPWLRYPQSFIAECAIRNQMAISFDPDGYAYKCWEVIGNTHYAIGQLEKNGSLKSINHVELHRQLYGSDPLEDKKCSKCSYLPICNGGCPLQRIQNEFENAHNDVCTPIKGFLSGFLKSHLALRKAGFENR